MKIAELAPFALLASMGAVPLACIATHAKTSPSPALSFSTVTHVDDRVSVWGAYVQNTIKILPSWEADTLAKFEQPELKAVRSDLEACIKSDPKSEDEFIICAQRLEKDWNSLEALDAFLDKADLI